MNTAATATQDPAASEPSALVSSALLLKKQLADKTAELKQVEEQLIALGAGKYAAADGRSVTVVGASSGSAGSVYYVGPSSEEEEEQIRKLCGEEFGNVFDRRVTFSPCEGFAAVVPKLLTPARARDLLALCARTSAGTSGKRAYLLYPKG